MAKLSIVAGATSQSVNIFIQDGTKTTGVGLTGLVFNTSGLIAYYTFTGSNTASTSITLATLSTVGSAYSSGGFKEIDATNMAGVYRLDIPNAAIATSKGRSSVIMLSGAASMAPVLLEIELTGWDNQDAVHGGLSALPNTAVTTNASLLTSGTGTDQISVSAGKLLLQATQSGVTIPTVTTVTNQLTAAAIATGVWQDTTSGDFTTASSIGKSLYTSGVVPGGTNGLFIAGTNAATSITSALTANITGNLSGSVGSVTGAVGSVTGAVGSVTGAVGSVTAQVTANTTSWGGTSVGAISPDAVYLRSGTAQAGASSTITLDAGASATNNLYQNATIFIRSGTGAGQTNIIASYVGATKVATVSVAWATNPDNTSVFTMLAEGPAIASVSGTVAANVTQWNGTNVASPATAGIPEVNVKNINNVSSSSVTTVSANQGTTQPINFNGTAGSAMVKSDVEQINTQTASASGTVTFPNATLASTANITGGTITTVTNLTNAPTAGDFTSTMKTSLNSSTPQANVATWDGTAVGVVPPDSVFIRSGTAQGGGASTITLDAGASATNNLYQNCVIFIRSGTGVGQSNIISTYVGSTKVATLSNAWVTNPDATSVFTIAAFGPVIASVSGTVTANVVSVNGHAVTDTTSGIIDVNVKNIATQTASAAAGVTFPSSIASPTNITAGTITTATNLTNAATSGDFTSTMKTSLNSSTPASITGAVGSVTGNVGGSVASVTGAVGSVTGAVGSVTGAVGSVTARVTANTDQWDGTSVSTIPPDAIFLRSGTAQGGGATTITLDASASATNNLYQNCVVFIRSGTGAGQSNIIASYVGSTKVATVSNTWATNPDATSVFTVAAFGPVIASVSGTVTANVTQVNGHAVTDTTSGILDVNVKNINTVSAASVTTINANQGTTQPVNFSGTAGSAFVKSDTEQLNAQTVTAGAGVTFPSSVASPTNITAGTITTATNLTNAPTSGDFTAAMKTSLNAATPASVTGAVGSVTGSVGSVVGAVGSVTGNVGGSVASVVGAVGSVTSGVTVTTNNDKTGYSLTQSFPSNFSALSIDSNGNVAVKSNVKKNTASAGFSFIMTSATTHAPMTGLTVTASISIDGGAFVAATNSVSEVSNGEYTINLAAADVNGNHIMLRATAVGADDCNILIVTDP